MNYFEDMGDLVPNPLPERSNRIVKVNLPDDRESYRRGNGEGCWAWIMNEEDVEKYNSGTDKFPVILLNSSLYYMGILKWGHVIMAEGRGPDSRPVMDIDWYCEKTGEEI